MRKKRTGTEGYLTVYAALSLSILLSLFFVLLEGARSNAVRMETEIVTDIGLNSIFAEYHRELLEQYNLFFIDTSYGSSQPSYMKTQEHLKKYLDKNLGTEDVFLGEWIYKDFFKLKLKDVKLTKLSIATDRKGGVFRKRAIEAVRDDIGVTYLETIKDWVDTVEMYGLDNRNVAEEKRELDERIEEYDGVEKQLSEEEWITVEVENPTSELERQRASGILKLVLEDAELVSQASVNMESLISQREKRGELIQGNLADTEYKETWIDRMLFQEYILRYSGRYGAERNKGALQYQAEYLISGKESDEENLKSVVHRISALREAANAIYLFSDDVKCMEAEALAAVLASAMLVPELTPVLKVSLLLGWAYAESLYDIRVLLDGGRVPLLKNQDNWHYDLDCVLGSVEREESHDFGTGLDYMDYLRVLLALTDTQNQTLRFMDIVEMDIRQTPGNRYFRLDGCADAIIAEVYISSHYGYDFQIIRYKDY